VSILGARIRETEATGGSILRPRTPRARPALVCTNATNSLARGGRSICTDAMMGGRTTTAVDRARHCKRHPYRHGSTSSTPRSLTADDTATTGEIRLPGVLTPAGKEPVGGIYRPAATSPSDRSPSGPRSNVSTHRSSREPTLPALSPSTVCRRRRMTGAIPAGVATGRVRGGSYCGPKGRSALAASSTSAFASAAGIRVVSATASSTTTRPRSNTTSLLWPSTSPVVAR
jgi:hypothetical protein